MINTSLLTSLSVKNENSIQHLYTINKDESNTIYNHNDDESNSTLLLPGQKIIVYNIEWFYLVPAIVVGNNKQNVITFNNKSENSLNDSMNNINNNKITLTFCEYEHKKVFGNEFELNKNDIYYENAGGFEMENNCINLDVINDLTLLRNIYLHLKYENKAYLYVGNILIALKHSHKINIANIKRDYEINEYILRSKCNEHILAIYYSSNSLSNNMNDSYDMCRFYTNVISAYFTYIMYNEECYHSIMMFINKIIFQLNIIRFIMIIDNYIIKWIPIFPTNSNQNSFLYTNSIFFPECENPIKLNNTSSYIINELKQEHIDYSFYNANIKNKKFIDNIYTICIHYMKNESLFKRVINLFSHAYLQFNKHNVFTSNILIMLMYFHLIRCFNIHITQNTVHLSKEHNGKLILVYNISFNEDDCLITESIRQELFIKKNNTTVKHNNNHPLTRFLWFYFETQITSYIKLVTKPNVTINLNINNIINTNSFNFDEIQLFTLDNNNNINYNYLCMCIAWFYSKSIYNIFNDVHLANTKQIWFLSEISPINLFENDFIRNQNAIPLFYNITHLISYCNEYKTLFNKSNFTNNNNITNTNGICLLYSNRDKLIKLQAVIRGMLVKELCNELKSKVIVIQKAFRSFIYKKVCRMNIELLIENVLLKYITFDLGLINYIVNIKREVNELRQEKEMLIKQIKHNNDIDNTNNKNIHMKNTLQRELDNIKEKNDKLIHKGEMYINQMKDIINVVNKNKEIQNVLKKNGIVFK